MDQNPLNHTDSKTVASKKGKSYPKQTAQKCFWYVKRTAGTCVHAHNVYIGCVNRQTIVLHHSIRMKCLLGVSKEVSFKRASPGTATW